jgi:hypothetical protein
MLTPVVRALVAVVAVLLLFGGLLSAPIVGLPGLWTSVVGAAALIALAIERNRYRSEEADRTFEPVGPGGGEPVGAIEGRFRRTEEIFVDPTTGHRMRVFVDGGTGERRYVAEP